MGKLILVIAAVAVIGFVGLRFNQTGKSSNVDIEHSEVAAEVGAEAASGRQDSTLAADVDAARIIAADSEPQRVEGSLHGAST